MKQLTLFDLDEIPQTPQQQHFDADSVCLGKRKTAGGFIWKYKQ